MLFQRLEQLENRAPINISDDVIRFLDKTQLSTLMRKKNVYHICFIESETTPMALRELFSDKDPIMWREEEVTLRPKEIKFDAK